ncbi:MAG: SDR family NAD(P)-dependent oxidoreductase [Myxococcales bacterium]|nr:SDR family oxidoreductase [Myxococcales bacterium]
MKETVVITGASRGIGRALAVEFAGRGHPLVLAARSRGDVAGTVVECDLTTPEGREKLLAASPAKIAGLVNNAGFATAGPFAEQDRMRERDVVRLNVEAVVDLCHLFLPRLQAGSFIINLASTAGFQPVPLFATYSASKAFVLSFSEALAEELAPRGIHVMALCPGVTESGFQKEANVALAPGYATSEEVAKYALKALDGKKRVAIHGTKNAFLIFSQRLSPRIATVKVARKIMEPWFKERH